MSGWINVKDRLPEKEGEYLCCVSISYGGYLDVLSFFFNLENALTVDFHKGKRCGWCKYDDKWGYLECEGVTHWMPLPEAPDR